MNEFKFWTDHFDLTTAKGVFNKEMAVFNSFSNDNIDYLLIGSTVATMALWSYIGYKTVKGGREIWRTRFSSKDV